MCGILWAKEELIMTLQLAHLLNETSEHHVLSENIHASHNCSITLHV